MDDATLLISIEYMRCVRRMQGRDEARKAFMRVRKAPGKRWETFVAAALLEWRYDKNDKVARNVFELGLKSFISQPAYVAQYADFLVGCNDVANARVLFERATAAAGGSRRRRANAARRPSISVAPPTSVLRHDGGRFNAQRLVLKMP